MKKGLLIAVLLTLLIIPFGCRAPAQTPPKGPTPAAKFQVTSLDVTPPAVIAGERVTVTAEVRNIGAREGTYTAVLTVNGTEVERKDVTIAPGATEAVTFWLVKDIPSTYQISVGGLSSTVTVITSSLSFGKVVRIESEPKRGFYWAYYLYIPNSMRALVKENKKVYLLVEPNNTGRTSDNQEVHDMAAKRLAEKRSLLAEDLRVPLLVPVFPRPQEDWKIYTHALDRDTLLTGEKELERIDLQLISMVDSAIEKLSLAGVNLERKILMMGFSASGMFVNRFAVLHPERVQAAAIGSPGGWPVAPLKEWDGVGLRYPIGIWDVEELVGRGFDIESFKSVPLYFYMGDKDTNDSVPYRDGYDQEDKELIFQHFGDTLVKRWPIAEEIYKSVGCSSQFVLYPGVGHSMTSEMLEDIITFFLNNLESR